VGGNLILFIIRKFYDYAGDYNQISNGLRTSAGFVVEMLKLEGHKAKLVEAIDGNCIDRLVAENKPRIVILEALWVTPEKLAELKGLHPGIRFVVRIHSEIPFLSNEGISVRWLYEYTKLGAEIAFNSEQARQDFEVVAPSLYLPNYYPVRKVRRPPQCSDKLNVGCFGAIRPMKNQLIQALGAIKYAKSLGKKLHFHMNGTRLEQGGDNNLKSIRAAIEVTGNELILHPWSEHEEFVETVQKMDICLQVSLTESFNLTSADAVSMGVPLIGSSAIRWLPRRSRALVDSAESIAQKMHQADKTTVAMNHESLENYVHVSAEIWNTFATY
jgi:glycosyltransferase involved in cell wall biosynthesis